VIWKRKLPETGQSLCNLSVSSKRNPPVRVGGQAVIEGVMMRSPQTMAVAVRRPDGEIAVKKKELTFFSEKSFFFKIPLIRGVIVLISALVLGIEALNFSANQSLAEEEKEPSSLTLGVTFGIALCFGIFLFFMIPLFLTKWLRSGMPLLSESGLLFNLVDGVIRLGIFLAYLWAISFIKDIRRIFQYHGAEHKSIFAFESGEELSVERVKGYSHLHPRCGTSFLLVVMLVSIFIFALVPHSLPFVYKAASRVVFIPFIAGISYEIIRFADRRQKSRGVSYLIRPGLWLQRLTAHEPSEAQIEVAIRALQEALNLETRREIIN
jgi:uncharacterized protein YqhQ